MNEKEKKPKKHIFFFSRKDEKLKVKLLLKSTVIFPYHLAFVIIIK